MGRLLNYLLLLLLLVLLVVVLQVNLTCAGGEDSSSSSSSSALFIFGDSTVDPGNNNYIETVPENRANHKPYGQNGFFQQSPPTGRFSDGRVIVDFIAEYAKLPLIPPFLEPSAEYVNGVNFGSGGAGILSETNQGLVIDLKTQLKNFEAVEKALTEKLGEKGAKKLISEAVYFISIGSNDYMGGYLVNPTMQQLHHPEEYVGMVIGNLTQAIQELYEKGGRKFGFLSLSPLGCLPALRAANPKGNEEGGCFEEACALALAHNNALKAVLTSLEHLFKGFKYCNSNFYVWLEDRINNPSKYGFKEGMNACCGTGPFRGLFTCGGTNKVTDYQLCDNADDYVWWDSFHPTERIHEQFAKALWDGPLDYVGPYNLQQLFFFNKLTSIADLVDDPESDTQQIY
ncbi:GDSL esterase/lipase 2-like isoform X3 [Camellia sinensis]|uniref:GDSL esterase/lipase 2-like isoform X3 n=1 Tax=Camellia sinensis TaxID=4442 RepID=UPI001036C5A2|nr:GDSL esterase/lipase 2-like isoform X3 [Camellia sinensis]